MKNLHLSLENNFLPGKALNLAFYAYERGMARVFSEWVFAIGSAILFGEHAGVLHCGKQVAKHLGISLFLPNYPRRHFAAAHNKPGQKWNSLWHEQRELFSAHHAGVWIINKGRFILPLPMRMSGVRIYTHLGEQWAAEEGTDCRMKRTRYNRQVAVTSKQKNKIYWSFYGATKAERRIKTNIARAARGQRRMHEKK